MPDHNNHEHSPPPPLAPPPHDPHHDPHSHGPRHFIRRLTSKVDFGEDIDFVIGATATALTADQLLKQTTCKDHKVMHLAKAGLAAGVAATAFTMMTREHDEKKRREALKRYYRRHPGARYRGHLRGRDHSSDSERSRSRSRKRRLLLAEREGRPYREDDWAVVRSRSPPNPGGNGPPRRAASVSVGHRDTYHYEDDDDRNPDYYVHGGRGGYSRSYDDLPYPDDSRRSYSPAGGRSRDRSRGGRSSPRRARSHSPRARSPPPPPRAQSKGAFTRILEVVRDGMDTYDRYDRSRR